MAPGGMRPLFTTRPPRRGLRNSLPKVLTRTVALNHLAARVFCQLYGHLYMFTSERYATRRQAYEAMKTFLMTDSEDKEIGQYRRHRLAPRSINILRAMCNIYTRRYPAMIYTERSWDEITLDMPRRGEFPCKILEALREGARTVYDPMALSKPKSLDASTRGAVMAAAAFATDEKQFLPHLAWRMTGALTGSWSITRVLKSTARERSPVDEACEEYEALMDADVESRCEGDEEGGLLFSTVMDEPFLRDDTVVSKELDRLGFRFIQCDTGEDITTFSDPNGTQKHRTFQTQPQSDDPQATSKKTSRQDPSNALATTNDEMSASTGAKVGEDPAPSRSKSARTRKTSWEDVQTVSATTSDEISAPTGTADRSPPLDSSSNSVDGAKPARAGRTSGGDILTASSPPVGFSDESADATPAEAFEAESPPGQENGTAPSSSQEGVLPRRNGDYFSDIDAWAILERRAGPQIPKDSPWVTKRVMPKTWAERKEDPEDTTTSDETESRLYNGQMIASKLASNRRLWDKTLSVLQKPPVAAAVSEDSEALSIATSDKTELRQLGANESPPDVAKAPVTTTPSEDSMVSSSINSQSNTRWLGENESLPYMAKVLEASSSIKKLPSSSPSLRLLGVTEEARPDTPFEERIWAARQRLEEHATRAEHLAQSLPSLQALPKADSRYSIESDGFDAIMPSWQNGKTASGSRQNRRPFQPQSAASAGEETQTQMQIQSESSATDLVVREEPKKYELVETGAGSSKMSLVSMDTKDDNAVAEAPQPQKWHKAPEAQEEAESVSRLARPFNKN